MSILKFKTVSRIPNCKSDYFGRSKYGNDLVRLSKMNPGTQVMIKNGGLSSISLYKSLKSVSDKYRLNNIHFCTRGNNLFAEVTKTQ